MIDEKQNIDHVVVSRRGIWALETKNIDGVITCEGDQWNRTRIGSKGEEYEGYIGSPSKQAKSNAIKIKNYLERQLPDTFKSLKLYVEPIVIIANEEAELNIKNPSTDIYTHKEIKKQIKNKNNNKKEIFNKKEIKNIIKELKKLK
ncbi:MAG: Nuclease-related protein, NERD family [Candidatus Methanohalarchaeum thermophilum]|uniref:Nuclease-related protein, NERD family n=1 Tax=Methanohalarchaeum thermophilum TaxID=1903181 RepID=A0A1Q6DWP1_METT1|nr:MAG: Nuclease-related protein, NERD family [Candidatus Methanohalarchaeum thermophilum]